MGTCFGIPGDYVLGFYSLLEKSRLVTIGCTREDCAGFAADAYARVHGMGAVCVTYCVGGLSLCNSIAGAYAEKSPVVVITGSPGLSERVNNPLLHHRVRDFRTQYDVFDKLCIACAELNEPLVAFHEIDRVLHAAASYKRPVYIEIPRDMVSVVPDLPHQFHNPPASSAPEVLAEAVNEAERWIANCQRPVIIGGVEIHRFGLQDDLLALAEGSQIPITTTMLGKSIIPETHPLFVGLYEGAMGNDVVTQFVEQSDCLILLGTFMTDLNLGIYTANLDPGKCIYATSEQLRIRHHHFHGVLLADFIRELADRKPQPPRRADSARAQFGDREIRVGSGRADHHSARDRPVERIAGRRNGGDRRHRRFAVRGDGTGDSRPHGVHQSGLLHLDGLFHSGRPGHSGGTPRSADRGHRRRRCVSNDRHGAVDNRPSRLSLDRDFVGQ